MKAVMEKGAVAIPNVPTPAHRHTGAPTWHGSVRYLLWVDWHRWCERNALAWLAPWGGRLAVVTVFLFVLLVPGGGVAVGALLALGAEAAGSTTTALGGVVVMVVLGSQVGALAGAAVPTAAIELTRPADGPHHVGLDLHPWAHAIAHVATPTLARALVGAVVSSSLLCGIELVARHAGPPPHPHETSWLLATVVASCLGGAMVSLTLRVWLARHHGHRTLATVALIVLAGTLAAVSYGLTHIAITNHWFAQPTDAIILAALDHIGALAAASAPWVTGVGLTAALVGGGGLMHTIQAARTAPAAYRIPGSLRRPEPHVSPSRGHTTQSLGRPTVASLLGLQLRHGQDRNSLLRRRLERALLLGGGVFVGFGAAVWVHGAHAQVGWLPFASSAGSATLTMLVALALTTASGPVSWIPRLRWLMDCGAAPGALGRSYVAKAVATIALPTVPFVIALALVQGSVRPLAEALVTVPFVAAGAIMADLVDEQRQENADGSAEGGLGGALVSLVTLAAAATVWLLPPVLAWVLCALGASGAVAGAVLLMDRRLRPWRTPSRRETHR